jgi:23S rRNA (guanosine2251-2'-O)-methyltransferase
MKNETIIILHDIRSAYNIGSIFRTADGAGVPLIYLTGHSPTPKDKYGRWRKDISKVALGAEKTIHWEYSKDINVVIEKLKNDGLEIVAVEQDKKSEDYKKFSAQSGPASGRKTTNKSTAYIFGNEVEGLPKSVLKQADSIIEIPMKGKKESLNVSVTAGIILFS